MLHISPDCRPADMTGVYHVIDLRGSAADDLTRLTRADAIDLTLVDNSLAKLNTKRPLCARRRPSLRAVCACSAPAAGPPPVDVAPTHIYRPLICNECNFSSATTPGAGPSLDQVERACFSASLTPPATRRLERPLHSLCLRPALTILTFLTFSTLVQAKPGMAIRWLSKEKMLKRFYNLRNDIADFMHIKNNPLFELSDPNGCDLAFLVDLTGYLNDLNLKLQKQGQLVNDLYSHLKAFQNKILLWEAHMLSGNSYHFTTFSAYENIVYAQYAEELK
ncbi:General transcription factor II-I repeat domain-containing protein 2 [Eumeta japonica]|uniref:General transcription factor II-I repeat domain-containing protein 2 n=1 Tax=Eumeta variegata TaxID=151549 RepID=A0A4C1WPX3_EUMVA|nr:General transcription factor II-I repeat domain-containing protein 2 [Eumeta japonica]